MADYRFYLDRVLKKKKLQDNYALRFDGVNDYCEVPDSLSVYSFIQNTLVFTIELRIKIIDLSIDSNIISTTRFTTEKGLTFRYADGQIRFFITKGINANPVLNCNADVNTTIHNGYNDIIIKSFGAGNNIEMIVNNTPLNVTYARNYSSLSTGDSTYNLHMGRIPIFSTLGNMEVDYIKIWNEYKTDDSDSGLVSHWKFNEGGGCIAADSVGGYDANLMPDCPTNSPEWIKL